jgi:hypothetical protein
LKALTSCKPPPWKIEDYRGVTDRAARRLSQFWLSSLLTDDASALSGVD